MLHKVNSLHAAAQAVQHAHPLLGLQGVLGLQGWLGLLRNRADLV